MGSGSRFWLGKAGSLCAKNNNYIDSWCVGMHDFPPLSAVRVFLVAIRTGGFTAAAHELCVTHGAVSRQIRSLEDWLGQKLFEKAGSRMVPTSHAFAFAREISVVCDDFGEVVQRYGKGCVGDVLRVSAPTTFAMRWLIPRLEQFHLNNPRTVIQVLTVTTQQQVNNNRFDLAIRCEPEPGIGYKSSVRFLSDYCSVIASPDLLKSKPLKLLSDLSRHVLLETETRPDHWQEWLAAADFRCAERLKRQRFDHFHVTIQCVIDGLGVGVGPIKVLGLDLGAGRLCAPFDDVRAAPHYYCMFTPVGIQKTALHYKFEQWLLENGGMV